MSACHDHCKKIVGYAVYYVENPCTVKMLKKRKRWGQGTEREWGGNVRKDK